MIPITTTTSFIIAIQTISNFGHLSNLLYKVIYIILESKLETNKQMKHQTNFG